MVYPVPDDWFDPKSLIKKIEPNFVWSDLDKCWLQRTYPITDPSNFPNLTVNFVDTDEPDWKRYWVCYCIVNYLSPFVGVNFKFTYGSSALGSTDGNKIKLDCSQGQPSTPPVTLPPPPPTIPPTTPPTRPPTTPPTLPPTTPPTRPPTTPPTRPPTTPPTRPPTRPPQTQKSTQKITKKSTQKSTKTPLKPYSKNSTGYYLGPYPGVRGNEGRNEGRNEGGVKGPSTGRVDKDLMMSYNLPATMNKCPIVWYDQVLPDNSYSSVYSPIICENQNSVALWEHSSKLEGIPRPQGNLPMNPWGLNNASQYSLQNVYSNVMNRPTYGNI
jgi:hypothetical protein